MNPGAIGMLFASIVQVVGLAACGTTKLDGLTALFDEPGPAARFTPGASRGAEVEALLGKPSDIRNGILCPDGRFEGSTLGVMPPGPPATEWTYNAYRYREYGAWPFGRTRGDSRSLMFAFDAAGVLRHVRRSEHEGQWMDKGFLTKLF